MKSAFCLVIILNMFMGGSLQAQERVAYVNETRLRQGYKLLLVFQSAEMEFTKISREINSLYQEKVFASEQSAFSSINRDRDRTKKKMQGEHMRTIEECRTQYTGKVSRCDEKILKAIVSRTKETGYDNWAPLKW